MRNWKYLIRLFVAGNAVFLGIVWFVSGREEFARTWWFAPILGLAWVAIFVLKTAFIDWLDRRNRIRLGLPGKPV